MAGGLHPASQTLNAEVGPAPAHTSDLFYVQTFLSLPFGAGPVASGIDNPRLADPDGPVLSAVPHSLSS